MKKGTLLLGAALAVFLTACVPLGQSLPFGKDEVKIDGEVYRAGFYRDLWVKDLDFTGEEYEAGGKTYRRVECGGFDCVQADVGPKTGGTVYCLDSQWEDAEAYFADSGNYAYYCGIGVKYSKTDPEIFEIEDVDVEKFEALAHFGGTFGYEPFDMVKNKAAEKKSVTIDAKENEPRPFIHFYKESKDGSFVSFRGDYFFILDGKLYLRRSYNLSEDIISATEVPEETAAYFIGLVEGFRREGCNGDLPG